LSNARVMRVIDIPVSSGSFRADAHVDREVIEDAKREAHKYLAATTSVTVNTEFTARFR